MAHIPLAAVEEAIARKHGLAEAGHVLSKYVRASYNPQPDITAYELATILPFFHGQMMTEADWDALGATQRHLKRID